VFHGIDAWLEITTTNLNASHGGEVVVLQALERPL
jgi:hypothetical protein